MKIEVDDDMITILTHLKGKNLLINGNLAVINKFDFVKESKIVKPLFSKEKVVVNNYVTNITILGFSNENKYFTRYGEKDCELILKFYDMQKFRRDWMKLHEQMTAFGIDIKIENLINN
jgi:hypothetical protein